MIYTNKKIELPNIANILDEVFNNDVWGINNLDITKKRFPLVNIIEGEKNFQVSMAAPGLTKPDFNIELNDEVLTISVHKELNNETSKPKYTIHEFTYNNFSRSFNLPENIDTENISAKYEKGLLIVMLPKLEVVEENKVKTIKIG
ncbi:MAG TPA: Hsp20/alpha crystallin family protein [Bacteroidetes bacterium]|nr:Hsp20/alpha crystallin family protein [Bacteroidota bacterium]